MPKSVKESTWLMRQTRRIQSMLASDTVFYPGYDEAIMGVVCPNKTGEITRNVIAYNMHRIIKLLQDRDGMSEEDALEFAEINIVGGWLGDTTPLHVWIFSAIEMRNTLELRWPCIPPSLIGFGHRCGHNTVAVFSDASEIRPVRVRKELCQPAVIVRTDGPTYADSTNKTHEELQ